jgi:hypothetical protein
VKPCTVPGCTGFCADEDFVCPHHERWLESGDRRMLAALSRSSDTASSTPDVLRRTRQAIADQIAREEREHPSLHR